MLPETVLSVRQIWVKCLFDLSLFHAAIFCSLILLLGHRITIQACFVITICFEIVTLLSLVLLRTTKPQNVCLKTFCEGSLSAPGREAEGIMDVLSRKWEFVHKAGGGRDAPENTMAAIMQSKQCSVAGIVADLRVTSDGVIVLCHDDVVRTTDGSGMVAKMTYKEVKRLNAAAKFKSANGGSFGHEPVPSLEEAIQLCHTLDLNILMELRDTSSKMIHSLLMIFKKYPWLYDKAVVCSFMPFVLYRIRKYNRYIMTGLKTRKNYLEWNYVDPLDPSWWTWITAIGDIVLTWSVYSWLWYVCGISFVLQYKDSMSRQVVDFWKRRDVCVMAWTVNDVTEKNFMINEYQIPVITDLLRSGYEPDRKLKSKSSGNQNKKEKPIWKFKKR